MKIVCAWCGKDMGEKPPYEDKSVTHSICPECKAKYFPEYEEEGSMMVEKEEYWEEHPPRKGKGAEEREKGASERYVQREVGRAIKKTEELLGEMVAKEEERKRLAALPKQIEDMRSEIATLERRITLLPQEHPLRYQALVRLATLKKNLEKAAEDLKRAEAEAERGAVIGEIRRTRTMLELMGSDLATRMERVEKTVAAKVAPAEIAAAAEEAGAAIEKLSALEGRLDISIRALTRGVPLWFAEEEMIKEQEWRGKIARGEATLLEEYVSARHRWRVWHDTECQTWVEAMPLHGS